MNPLALARWNRRRLSVALLVAVIGAAGCNKLKARDWLNKGVQAYKNGQFDTAIEDFKQAKDLDPGLLNARLYLATAYASQYIPGRRRRKTFVRASRPSMSSSKSWRSTRTVSLRLTASAPFFTRWRPRLTRPASSRNRSPTI